MRKIWKRYLALAFALLCMVCLTACSSEDEDTISYNAETEEYVVELIRAYKAQGYDGDMEVMDYVEGMMGDVITYIEQNYINAEREDLESMVKEDEEYYVSQASYLEATEGLGAYKTESAKNMTFEVGEEGMSATGTISFEKRDVMFSLNQDEDNNLTITFEKDLTLGEILKKAGINTLLGMGTVFLVLILISLIIWCLGFVSKVGESGSKAEPVPAAPVPVPVAEDIPEEEDVTDDLELAAVISAAIAAAEGTSADGFVVRSIKRVNNSKWRRA